MHTNSGPVHTAYPYSNQYGNLAHAPQTITLKYNKIEKKMNKAEPIQYGTSNVQQKRDALRCLEEFSRKIKWRSHDTAIDIGCGDGGVTTDILKKFLPPDYERVVGVDINGRMVHYANECHGDERTSFDELDIESPVLPERLQDRFYHAFSFYTLHWIKDQERAFTNIYNTIKKDGDCLLVFLGVMPVYEIFRRLSKMPKWKSWMKDVERFVSPYHDSKDPEKEVRRTMARVGFQDIDVQCKQMTYIYPTIDLLKKSVSAINPFQIPEELKEEFLEDYLQLVRELRLIHDLNNNVHGSVGVCANYTLIVAYGRK